MAEQSQDPAGRPFARYRDQLGRCLGLTPSQIRNFWRRSKPPPGKVEGRGYDVLGIRRWLVENVRLKKPIPHPKRVLELCHEHGCEFFQPQAPVASDEIAPTRQARKPPPPVDDEGELGEAEIVAREKARAEARLKETQAAKAELELEEQRKNLVKSSELQGLTTGLRRVFYGALDALEKSLPTDLQDQDHDAIQAILAQRFRLLKDDLAKLAKEDP